MTDASGRALRRWAFVVLAGSAAVAVYVSLVPFTFVRPPSDWIETFRRTLERTMSSRGNFLANILLFVPIGLAGTALITGARGHWLVRALAGLVVTVFGVAFSIGIEMMQVLLPGRTPSLSDITAQAMGALVGASLWVILASEAGRIVEVWRSQDRGRLVPGLLGAYTAVRVLILLVPLDVTVDLGNLARKYRDGRILINPLRSPIFEPSQWSALLLLVAVSLPVGLFASVVGVRHGARRSPWISLAISTAILGFAEIAQVFIMSTRADAGQFLANALGGAAGVLLAHHLMGGAARTADGRAARGLVPAAFVGLSLAFYAAYHWVPFDFQVPDAETARRKLSWLTRVPFEGYYQNPEFTALAELFVKVGLAVPIGLTLRWWASGLTRLPRLAAAVSLSLAAMFILGIELGQVILPSRFPDNTDVLLGCVGLWPGGPLDGCWG